MARDKDIRSRKPSCSKIAVSKPLCTFNGHTCQGKKLRLDAEGLEGVLRRDLLTEVTELSAYAK
jgi:hypothetical protein